MDLLGAHQRSGRALSPEALVYGVQRRVEIARALMGSPAVLLLDEPAAGMNDVEAGRIVTVLRELARRGLAVLLVEHNITVVTSVSGSDGVRLPDAVRGVGAGGASR